MDFLRKILWVIGFTIIIVTIINVASAIINVPLSIFWFVLGGLFIGITELYVFLRDLSKVRNVGEIIDQYLRITETQLINHFEDKPAFKVLPIFRNYKKGILIMTSGKYIHYNEKFIEKFIDAYEKNNNTTELSKEFKYSKTEIHDIIKKLKEINKI